MSRLDYEAVDTKVIGKADISDYFHQQLKEAMSQQSVELAEATASYVVNLLSSFVHTEQAYDNEESLALNYLNSTVELSAAEKMRLLKQVGDQSLYWSGFFAESLKNKLVDIDYYLTMGGSAYLSLTSLVRDDSFASLFSELSSKFPDLVSVLSIMSATKDTPSNGDVLKLYERWLNTGHRHLYERLVDLGLIPVHTEGNS